MLNHIFITKKCKRKKNLINMENLHNILYKINFGILNPYLNKLMTLFTEYEIRYYMFESKLCILYKNVNFIFLFFY